MITINRYTGSKLYNLFSVILSKKDSKMLYNSNFCDSFLPKTQTISRHYFSLTNLFYKI